MCRERVTAAILNNLKEKNISWPTQQEIQDEVNAFQQRNGFSGIVGAIDGTHIRIKTPSSHPQSTPRHSVEYAPPHSHKS
jgi:hypothetical protein